MNQRVLIVDDEESILTILKKMMEREGYEVFTVPSAEEAIDLFKREQAFNTEEGKFDLIITDVVMPKMNGYELAKLILEKLPDQPILFISGFNSSRELVTLIDNHQNLEYQSKPFGFEDIKRKISQIIVN